MLSRVVLTRATFLNAGRALSTGIKASIAQCNNSIPLTAVTTRFMSSGVMVPKKKMSDKPATLSQALAAEIEEENNLEKDDEISEHAEIVLKHFKIHQEPGNGLVT